MMRDTAQQKRKETRRTQTARNEDDVAPPEDFAKLSIFPDLHDMDWTEKPFLRANKAAGAFKDVHHYLDVQFRLLREDYIRPLRNGIREYQRAKKFGEAIAKNFDLKL
nr:hypothetical protein BaRGS_017893 [Batillaria attramentaria]